MKLSRFVIWFHLYAIAIAVLALGLQHMAAPTELLSPHFWALFIGLFVLTLTAYVISDLGIRKGGEVSIYGLMGGIFIKMMLSLVLVTVIIFKFPEYKLINGVNFFSIYLLFTVFEITCLLRNLRDQKKTQKIGDR